MKPLDVRFRDTTELKLRDLAEKSGMSKSDIARIAMMWGINDLTNVIAKGEINSVKLSSLKVEALKAKQ